MWTPGQSGTCSPAIAAGSDHTADIPMSEVISDEFAFGSCNTAGLVKAWEGERIHEESGSDDLELTLGCSKTRQVNLVLKFNLVDQMFELLIYSFLPFHLQVNSWTK